MTNPFIGEIRAFSFQFAPSGWQLCNGQILPIAQYQALFSLLGTTYGGNGVQTFGLPDLRGRVALHIGPSNPQGQILGEEMVALNVTQLPQHNHQVAAAANGTTNGTNIPSASVILGNAYTGQSGNPAVNIYAAAQPSVALTPLGANGSGQGHENRMPSLVMNYCIAMNGIYPSRP
jgi:microcystin-dependent protein